MKIPEETSERDYARTNTKYYINSRGRRRRRTALNPFSLLLLGCSLFLSSLVLAKASLFFFPLFFRRRARFVLSHRVALHFEFRHNISHKQSTKKRERWAKTTPRRRRFRRRRRKKKRNSWTLWNRSKIRSSLTTRKTKTTKTKKQTGEIRWRKSKSPKRCRRWKAGKNIPVLRVKRKIRTSGSRVRWKRTSGRWFVRGVITRSWCN